MSEPEEAAGANMAIDLFDSVQGQEFVLQGEDFWDSLEALWPGALSPTPVGSAERCFSACRAARCGASQPAGQRGAVLLSLHPPSGSGGSGTSTTQPREPKGLSGLSRSVRSQKA